MTSFSNLIRSILVYQEKIKIIKSSSILLSNSCRINSFWCSWISLGIPFIKKSNFTIRKNPWGLKKTNVLVKGFPTIPFKTVSLDCLPRKIFTYFTSRRKEKRIYSNNLLFSGLFQARTVKKLYAECRTLIANWLPIGRGVIILKTFSWYCDNQVLLKGVDSGGCLDLFPWL